MAAALLVTIIVGPQVAGAIFQRRRMAMGGNHRIMMVATMGMEMCLIGTSSAWSRMVGSSTIGLVTAAVAADARALRLPLPAAQNCYASSR